MRSHGSERGVLSNQYPYRDYPIPLQVAERSWTDDGQSGRKLCETNLALENAEPRHYCFQMVGVRGSKLLQALLFLGYKRPEPRLLPDSRQLRNDASFFHPFWVRYSSSVSALARALHDQNWRTTVRSLERPLFAIGVQAANSFTMSLNLST